MSTASIKTRLYIPDCKLDKHTSTTYVNSVLMLSDLRFNPISISDLLYTYEAKAFEFKYDNTSILWVFNILVLSTVLNVNSKATYIGEPSTSCVLIYRVRQHLF